MRSLRRIAGVVAAAMLVLAACGDDDDSSADETGGADAAVDASGAVLEVAGLDSLSFEPDTLSAAAGAITIEFDNQGALEHTFLIEGIEGFKLANDDSGTVTLEAGEYVFYCDVAGHREGGMEGTLTVS